jgi:hypothetical protein
MAIRPYHFMTFDIEIEKKKKRYVELSSGGGSGGQRTSKINELNEELVDIKSVMVQNINDIIGRGEKLDGSGLFPFSFSLLPFPFCCFVFFFLVCSVFFVFL